MNNDPKHRQNDLDFGFSGNGWLGGTGYQENNEFGNNNFDDINTYDNNFYQQPPAPHTQNPPQYQYTNNAVFQNDTSGMPYRDEYRDPFNSRETKELEQAVEAVRTPPLPPMKPGKLSAGLKAAFFIWVILTTGATVLSIFNGEVWVTFPYAIQLCSGLIAFFVTPPSNRGRVFTAFIIIDFLFIAGAVALRLIFPMFDLALSRHSAIHLLEVTAFFTGFSMSVGKIILGPKRKINCTEPVEGKCMRVITDYISDGRGSNVSIYRPIYQYEYKGQHYESFDNDNPTLKVPATASVNTIMVDPHDPSDIFVTEKKTRWSVFFFFFGLALMAGSVIFLIAEMSETLYLMMH